MNSTDENELQEWIKKRPAENEVPFWERPNISRRELQSLECKIHSLEAELDQLRELPEADDLSIPVVCENCGRLIGQLGNPDGHLAIWDGKKWLQWFDGVCRCTKRIYWRKSDEVFAAIVERIETGNRGKCIKI
jgi:hypothetical protein